MQPISKITSKVPYPITNGKYPWRAMKVNDSFLVRDPSIKSTYISTLAANAGKRLGWKFSVRTTLDGIRVWRIA
jgi:hypothetical protein